MNSTFSQMLRFGTIGILSNIVGYCLYLLMTNAGVGHKLAMTLLFGAGTLQTFVFNKKWSFKYREKDRVVLLRYLASYGLGYIVNLMALVLLVDLAHFPHTIVQAVLIFCIATLMFVLQKFWVFPNRNKSLTCSEPA